MLILYINQSQFKRGLASTFSVYGSDLQGVLCPRSAGIDLNLHWVRRRHVEGLGALLCGLPPQDVQKSTSMQTGSSVDILRGAGVIANKCYAHRLQESTSIQMGSVVDILRARERLSKGFHLKICRNRPQFARGLASIS